MIERHDRCGLSKAPGTYALILERPAPQHLRVGRLGPIEFGSAFYFYSGSAFGPGGLAARLGHHLRESPRPHWHIDFLRRSARIVEIWTTTDPRRLECAWFAAARSLRGARTIEGFGSSDCRQGCGSHLKKIPAPFSP